MSLVSCCSSSDAAVTWDVISSVDGEQWGTRNALPTLALSHGKYFYFMLRCFLQEHPQANRHPILHDLVLQISQRDCRNSATCKDTHTVCWSLDQTPLIPSSGSDGLPVERTQHINYFQENDVYKLQDRRGIPIIHIHKICHKCLIGAGPTSARIDSSFSRFSTKRFFLL